MNATLLRTCVGCRTRERKNILLRLVADTRGHLVLDVCQRLPGRGVYVCPSPTCIENASRRSAWGRSLKRGVAAKGPADLHKLFVEAIGREVHALMETGVRDGRATTSEKQAGGGERVSCGERSVTVTDRELGKKLTSLVEQLRCLSGIEVRVR